MSRRSFNGIPKGEIHVFKSLFLNPYAPLDIKDINE